MFGTSETTGKSAAWSREDLQWNIPHHFERWAGQYPERMAVSAVGIELSYGALHEVSNGIARALLETEVDASRPIILLLEHGATMVAAILGVLKAGRICVCLDTSFPEARAAAIMEDSQAGIVVTDSANHPLADRLCHGIAAVVVVDQENLPRSDTNPSLPLAPDLFSTIVYTSGSTGQPKGVIQTHGNALRHVRAWTNGLGIRSGDRIALLASPSVGQGMNTVLAALLNGASLHPFDLKKKGLASLGAWLAQEGITVLITTPTVLRHLAALLVQGPPCPALRLVILAGETLKWSDVAATRKVFPPECVFANTLSGTETGNVTQFIIAPTDPIGEGNVPVGRVVEEMEVRLLNENGTAVAAGVIGEITVVSRYLSPGYWRNHEQTEISFGILPSGGLRFYRSGDLGKISADGCLEHLGRKDTQVKIRGHRVELEEVEETLRKLPGIQEVAVLAQPDVHGENCLVAYLTKGDEGVPHVAELRRDLGKILPLHMVPSQWVFVDVFPLTPMGKLDRRLLPTLCRDQASQPDETGHVEPEDEAERQIAAVWSTVLRVDRVGRDDNFFELGGDSLRAAAIAAKLHGIFGVELDLADFADHPTVAEMAGRVRALQSGSQKQSRSPIPRVPRGAPLPASSFQESVWQNSQTPEGAAGYTCALTDCLKGSLDRAALQKSLDHILRRHEILRSRFEMRDGRLLQIVLPPAPVDLPLIVLENFPNAGELAVEELQKALQVPFDLGSGPLVRFKLVRLGPEEHWLIRTSHYIIGDGGSWKIFYAELAELYEACSRGASLSPEEPVAEYADYAVWQQARFQPGSPAYADDINWWKQSLAGAVNPTVPPLRRPAPEPDAPVSEGSIQWQLEPAVSRQLDQLGGKCGATYYAVRLALFSARLALESGDSDIILGMYASNRLHPEVQRMMGCFLNLTILRLPFEGKLNFREWISRVGRIVIETQMHSEMPHELLRKELLKVQVSPPYLQTIFGIADEKQPFRTGDLEISRVLLPWKNAETMPWGFTMTLASAEVHSGWGTFFDARIYDPRKVHEFITRLQKFAEIACREPERPLADLEPGLGK